MPEYHKEEQEAETAERLDLLGKKILYAARDELYLGMRFLDVALNSFSYQMNTKITPFGTDGAVIFFHPQQLGGLYRQNRILVNRGYLHMVYHCIFRHMWKNYPLTSDLPLPSGEQTKDTSLPLPLTDQNDPLDLSARLWNLSCDIAVEHLIDENFHRSVRFSRSLPRRETYRKLEQEKKTLHAERIFRLLVRWNLPEKDLLRLEQEFYVDDHQYWENHQPDSKPDSNFSVQKKWQKINEQMETDLETFSRETAEKSGDLLGQLKIETREQQDYREFLRKFSVLREEPEIDPDTFDYTFYSYGLSLYGNMPLIEPLETKEVNKIAEFVIVIDTSMSCSGDLVHRFLEETCTILSESESFFHKVNVHILQCDETVQSDVKITCRKDLLEYMEHLTLYGEGGTDFRPAFAYVDEMIRQKEFQNLRGLLYFTDGYGIYPQKMPSYQTVFVFMQEDEQDVDVPAWAMTYYLPVPL
ncbi:MAG: metallopeptidase [Ruminococcus sp.]|nr:metallopeptidase [Ruminococcus sp.]